MNAVDPQAGQAPDRPHAVVIGSGFGGIAAALRCRALGLKVTLLERLDRIGGRAQTFERGGFRHDAGPTVITAPFLFDELYQLFGETRSDYFSFVPVDPWYRFYFHTGETFDYCDDMDRLNAEIARFSPEDVAGYQKLLRQSKAIFDVGFTRLAHKSFGSFWTMLAQVPALIRLGAYRTVSGMVNRFIRHPLLRRAFSIQPLLVGGNPFSTTSIYSLIQYVERQWGVHFCPGGTGRMVAELRRLMERQGIRILTGADVASIEMNGAGIRGVTLKSGHFLPADHVICNADPPTVYREMLDRSAPRARRPKRPIPEAFTKYSMGLYVLYFGTTKQYPEVAHHTIWLGRRFKDLLSDIFDAGTLTEDFSLYIHRPTATDPDFAPDGCDSFYVLCPVPHLKFNIDWDSAGPHLRNRIVTALGETILPDLEQTITADFWMEPRDFKANYRSTYGAGFSIAPVFSQSAWFRYHNRDPHIRNLFFVGAGTHPGAGLPGVISSAKVVEALLKQDMAAQTAKSAVRSCT